MDGKKRAEIFVKLVESRVEDLDVHIMGLEEDLEEAVRQREEALKTLDYCVEEVIERSIKP